jgi:glutathione synthase/RimK-type ligase-like ATP-grasp enzyme
MKIGIHYDHGKEMYPFCQIYEKILEFNKIDFVRLHIDETGFWEKAAVCDVIIFRWGHNHSISQLAKTILPIIENEMKVKVFPNQKTCWHYDDKITQYYLLSFYGYPIIKSWIFWDKTDATNWIKEADFPLVLKLKKGAGSTNVLLIKNEMQAVLFIKKLFNRGTLSTDFNLSKSTYLRRKAGKLLRKLSLRKKIADEFWEIEKDYVLFQKFLSGNEFDTRVTVIGGRAFAFRRMNRIADFRASGSGSLDHDISKIDPVFITKALEISARMGFQSMAYDFIYDEFRQPGICEISYTYNDLAVLKCPGYWDKQLNWHEGHYYPQYFQLIDLLNLPDLKNPIF